MLTQLPSTASENQTPERGESELFQHLVPRALPQWSGQTCLVIFWKSLLVRPFAFDLRDLLAPGT